jgi:arylsulfatase A-like enzyme
VVVLVTGVPAGSSCGELISFADMLATVASLLGEKLPDDAGEDSFDISPLLVGKKPAMPIRHGMVHVNYGSYTLAIREGDWKLILPSDVYVAQDGTLTPEQRRERMLTHHRERNAIAEAVFKSLPPAIQTRAMRP